MASPSRSVSFEVLESLRSASSVPALMESRTSTLCAARAGSLSLTLPTLIWKVSSVALLPPLLSVAVPTTLIEWLVAVS